jgi:hypothetical protein
LKEMKTLNKRIPRDQIGKLKNGLV